MVRRRYAAQRAPLALLNALLGNWDRKGGLFLADVDEDRVLSAAEVSGVGQAARRQPERRQVSIRRRGAIHDPGLRKATLTWKPYPIKGWFVDSSNLLHALPQPRRDVKAIDALDLLVVVDTMPSEIAGYADVVLPQAMFLERHDELLARVGPQAAGSSLRQPVVPAPPANQKPGWWIAKQMAATSSASARTCCSTTSNSICATGSRSPICRTRRVEARRRHPRQGASRSMSRMALELAFDTPSGKVEFWSDQLAAKGFDPVPKYPRARSRHPTVNFRLITGRAPVHTFSRTQNNALLRRPDADERGVGECGDRGEGGSASTAST